MQTARPRLSDPVLLSDAEQAAALFGPSEAIAKLSSQIRRLAPYLRTVFLAGANDCGQEALARLILLYSARPDRTFVKIEPLEAEQRICFASFGKESFHDSFLFLPHVDQLSMISQEYILQLLSSRGVGKMTIVAASQEDLQALSSLKRFLPELAAALGHVSLHVPSLKERKDDLPMMVGQLIQLRCLKDHRQIPILSKSFLHAAGNYQWPGNLREMSQMTDYLLREKSKNVWHYSEWERAAKALKWPEPSPQSVELVRLNTVIDQHIAAVMIACRGNKMQAANILGVSRSTLYRLLEDGKVAQEESQATECAVKQQR